MKKHLTIFSLLLISVAASPQELQHRPADAVNKPLPDSPVPKINPCEGLKAGELCNGRRYYPDLLGLDKENKTFWEAAKSPGMLSAGLLMVFATVADVESTQHCIHQNRCKEGNPLLGQSRGQEYAVSMGLNAVVFGLAVERKKSGHGVLPFLVMYGNAAWHFFNYAHDR